MDETEIVEKLRQTVTPAPEPIIVPAVPDGPVGQATTAAPYELDEITQYKLHDYFGAQYKPNDEISRQQVKYIYEQVAGMLEDPQYGFVLAKIRYLEQIIGTSNDERRIYKLYQWLKLEGVRKNIDAEMEALRG